MVHAFSVELATDYGVNCAILLGHFWYWTKKNKESGKHFHDGRYWTYNTQDTYAKLYPYMGRMQVRTAIRRLIDEGLIIEGNFNQKAFDHTKWYALTEKGLSLLRSVQPPNGYNNQSNGYFNQSNGQNSQSNGCFSQSNGQNNHAIPVNRTNYSNPFIEPVEEQGGGIDNPFAEYDSRPHPDFNTVEIYASSNLRNMTGQNMEEFQTFRDDLSDDMIRYAIDEACANGHPIYSYVRSILNRYIECGFKTLGDVKAYEQERQKKKGGKGYEVSRGSADSGDYKPLPGEIVV